MFIEPKSISQQTGPKRSVLVTNLLNRADGNSLAIRKLSGGGIEYYFEPVTKKHLKANKESLANLNYDELVQLLEGNPLQRKTFVLDMFVLDWHHPERIVETKEKQAVVGRSFKQADQNTGSSKFNDEAKKKVKPSNPGKRFTKK